MAWRRGISSKSQGSLAKVDHSGWNRSAGPAARCQDEERQALLGGPAALREKQASDFASITDAAAEIGDPRLRALVSLFLQDFGDRFRRAAAARANHHARRGGLVEHVAQMLRAAQALTLVYQDLNADLLIAGVIFHDCGKLWENALPPMDSRWLSTKRGELGHISIGIEVVNALWRKLMATEQAAEWTGRPASQRGCAAPPASPAGGTPWGAAIWIPSAAEDS
jgi:3'-5' exoribonuclease